MEQKTKVLIVIENALDIGGVQNVMMCLVRNLHEQIDFDIVVTNKKQGYYDQEFLSYGEIHIIERRKKAGIRSIFADEKATKKKIAALLAQEKYDAIYCNNMFNAGVFLKAAKKAGVPIRIAHSQVAAPSKIKWYSKLLYAIKRKKIVKNATDFLAVTQESADFLFGKKNRALVVKNPVFSVDEFKGLADTCDDTEVRLLHLGNLSPRKNAAFSVCVLEELIKLDKKFRLTIAGNGDENYIKLVRELIESKGLAEYIRFVPTFVDVKEELSAHNYLILPSINEGLPCVLLQGQVIGAKCFVSDQVEPICDQGLCAFLPLDKGAAYWAERIFAEYQAGGGRKTPVDMSDWDAAVICKSYQNLFQGKGFQ